MAMSIANVEQHFNMVESPC